MTHPTHHANGSVTITTSTPERDLRPMSVKRLEALCAKLQRMIEAQEREIEDIKRTINSSVTHQHLDLLLVSKVSSSTLDSALGHLRESIASMLEDKVDRSEVELLANGRVSADQVRDIRTAMQQLRNDIEDDARMLESSSKHNPFDRLQNQMADLLTKVRVEHSEQLRQMRLDATKQKQEMETRARMRAEQDEAKLAKLQEEAEMQRQLTEESAAGRIQLSEKEKDDFRARLARLELGLQLAAAQRGMNIGNDGPSAGTEEPSHALLSESAFNQHMDSMAEKHRHTIESLNAVRQRCDQSEEDLSALRDLVQNLREQQEEARTKQQREHDEEQQQLQLQLQAERLPGGLTNQEFDTFQKKLADVQRRMEEFHHSSFGHGDGDGNGQAYTQLEQQLLSRAEAASNAVQSIRERIDRQNRLKNDVLNNLAQARSTLARSIDELYASVSSLSERVKVESETLGKKLVSCSQSHDASVGEHRAWRGRMEHALSRVDDALNTASTQLLQYSQPLVNQLSVAKQDNERREQQVQRQLEEEYETLRIKYEQMVERERKRTAHQQEEKAQIWTAPEPPPRSPSSSPLSPRCRSVTFSPSTPGPASSFYFSPSPSSPPSDSRPQTSSSPWALTHTSSVDEEGDEQATNAALGQPVTPRPTPPATARTPSNNGSARHARSSSSSVTVTPAASRSTTAHRIRPATSSGISRPSSSASPYSFAPNTPRYKRSSQHATSWSTGRGHVSRKSINSWTMSASNETAVAGDHEPDAIMHGPGPFPPARHSPLSPRPQSSNAQAGLLSRAPITPRTPSSFVRSPPPSARPSTAAASTSTSRSSSIIQPDLRSESERRAALELLRQRLTMPFEYVQLKTSERKNGTRPATAGTFAPYRTPVEQARPSTAHVHHPDDAVVDNDEAGDDTAVIDAWSTRSSQSFTDTPLASNSSSSATSSATHRSGSHRAGSRGNSISSGSKSSRIVTRVSDRMPHSN